MKYFTLFIILNIMVAFAADDCKTGTTKVEHCTTCNPCNIELCSACDSSAHYVLGGSNNCVCDATNKYSEKSGACIKCDDHCDMTDGAHGCSTQGTADKKKCDTKCEGQYSLITGNTDSDKDYTCVKCHDYCAMSGTDTTKNYGCSEQGKEGVTGKCDEVCQSGYTLDGEDTTHKEHAGTYTCLKCDDNCSM